MARRNGISRQSGKVLLFDLGPGIRRDERIDVTCLDLNRLARKPIVS